ncbi:hypothetical protein [Methylobacterium sp. 17Sr1-1]|nr:hypothetical protein [Methylobacterium sp. 17Sr1-1]
MNPKAWIVAAGALATDTAQAEAAPLAATVALAILFGLVALPCSGFGR